MTLARGGTATLRLSVGRYWEAKDADVVVRLDAGRGLVVPAELSVGHGQEEVEFEVRAGDEAGVFVVKAKVEGSTPDSPPAECRVTVGSEPGLPSSPGGSRSPKGR